MDGLLKSILSKYIDDPDKLKELEAEIITLQDQSTSSEEIEKTIHKFIPGYMESFKDFLMDKEYLIDEVDHEWTDELHNNSVIIYLGENTGVEAYGFEDEETLLQFIDEHGGEIFESYAKFIYVENKEKVLQMFLVDKMETQIEENT